MVAAMNVKSFTTGFTWWVSLSSSVASTRNDPFVRSDPFVRMAPEFWHPELLASIAT
jgi:hypothetical protein